MISSPREKEVAIKEEPRTTEQQTAALRLMSVNRGSSLGHWGLPNYASLIASVIQFTKGNWNSPRSRTAV